MSDEAVSVMSTVTLKQREIAKGGTVDAVGEERQASSNWNRPVPMKLEGAGRVKTRTVDRRIGEAAQRKRRGGDQRGERIAKDAR